MSIFEPSTAGFSHPEWVNGRRLWMDSTMRDVVHRIRFGDPVKGWEGDERLAVYWCQPDERWELWRLEDDGVHRFVCRSAPGVPFDLRVIDALLAWDRQRQATSLHERIVAHNERVDAEREQWREDWVREDIGPRLRHAFRKDL